MRELVLIQDHPLAGPACNKKRGRAALTLVDHSARCTIWDGNAGYRPAVCSQAERASPVDEMLFGAGVPRRARTGGRAPRTWRTSVLQESLEVETVHQDEIEALEALCCLRTGSCDLADNILSQQPAQQQQHSKGSSYTAEAVAPGSKTAAVMSRHQSGRLSSPSSDVSSGACQGDLLPADHQCSQPAEALPLPLEEIHPGAHPVDIDQLVPASLRRKLQQQHKDGTLEDQQKQEQQQPGMPQDACQRAMHVMSQQHYLAAASGELAHGTPPSGPCDVPSVTPGFRAVPGLSSIHDQGPPPQCCRGQTETAGCMQQLLTAPAVSGTSAACLPNTLLPPSLVQLLQASQLCAGLPAAGLSPPQVAALAAVAAAGVGAPLASLLPQPHQQQQPGLAQLLQQLLLSTVLPGGTAAVQQQQQAAHPVHTSHTSYSLTKPAVKTGHWHVYISKMIAQARQQEEQQHGQQRLPQGQLQQQQNGLLSPNSVSPFADVAAEGSPSKRRKKQSAAADPATGQQLPQEQAGLPPLASLGIATGLLPQPALAAAAAAAGASSQLMQLPMQPMGWQNPLANMLGSAGLVPGPAGALFSSPVMPSASAAAFHGGPGSGLAPELLVQLLGAQQPVQAAVAMQQLARMAAGPGPTSLQSQLPAFTSASPGLAV